MSGEWTDERIQRAFANWRKTEAGDPPAFDAMYASARGRAATHRTIRPPSGVWRWTALAAAILVALGIGSLVRRQHPSPSSRPTGGTPSLSDWHSPTAFLLPGPGDALVNTVPTLSTSTIDLNPLGGFASHRRSP